MSLSNQNKSLANQPGFTLIELLVVIAIIGILSTVVIGAVGRARESARISAAVQHMASIRNQAEIYAGDNNGSYAKLCSNKDIIGAITKASLSLNPSYTVPIAGIPQDGVTGNIDPGGTQCGATSNSYSVYLRLTKDTTGNYLYCVSNEYAGKVKKLGTEQTDPTGTGKITINCPE